MTFGEKVIAFHQNLKFDTQLPEGFKVLNPFISNPETMQIMRQFYSKYYNDKNTRRFIIAINPGRLGAGTTGIPFTDTKRLKEFCQIEMQSANTHEISAVFVYNMIKTLGGVKAFYNQFYINSVFPLAIVKQKQNGNWVNANYYDRTDIYNIVKPYMIKTLKQNIAMGIDTSEVFILGKKNAKYIAQINKEEQLFEKLTILEHPRYIQQYKSKAINFYLDKYKNALFNKNV